MRPESGIWIAINWPKIGKMTMTSKFVDITSSCHFLTFFLNFFCQFSCWFKFHVNIIAGSGVTTIFFYKGLTRNPEIRNTAVWVLPNIWRLGQVRDNKFGMNASNKMLLNAAKCQSYSFYCFWVIKWKPVGRRKVGVRVKSSPLNRSGLIFFTLIFLFLNCFEPEDGWSIQLHIGNTENKQHNGHRICLILCKHIYSKILIKTFTHILNRCL